MDLFESLSRCQPSVSSLILAIFLPFSPQLRRSLIFPFQFPFSFQKSHLFFNYSSFFHSIRVLGLYIRVSLVLELFLCSDSVLWTAANLELCLLFGIPGVFLTLGWSFCPASASSSVCLLPSSINSGSESRAADLIYLGFGWCLEIFACYSNEKGIWEWKRGE